MHRLVWLLVVSVVTSSPVRAQLQRGAGIQPVADVRGHPSRLALLRDKPASAPETAGRSGGWKWAAIGAVAGAAVVGTVGATRQARRSGDTLWSQPAMRFSVVGALAGGVVGRLAHAVAHRATAAMSPNDR